MLSVSSKSSIDIELCFLTFLSSAVFGLLLDTKDGILFVYFENRLKFVDLLALLCELYFLF